jgi:small subunit ribosomal protein S17
LHAPDLNAVQGEYKMSQERGKRKTAVGVVTSDKMNKTRRVEIPRLVKHAKYSKFIKRRTICYVHDEQNESHTGDRVEIMETRPLSKNKNWRLVRIVARAKGGPVEAGVSEPAQPPA